MRDNFYNDNSSFNNDTNTSGFNNDTSFYQGNNNVIDKLINKN